MINKNNLNRCEAYRKGDCLFGCDAVADNFYNSEEALDENYFDYYLNRKFCETLRKTKERSNDE